MFLIDFVDFEKYSFKYGSINVNMFLLIIISLIFLFGIGGLCCSLLLDSKPIPLEIDEEKFEKDNDSKLVSSSCTICGDHNCNREGPGHDSVDHSKPCISEKNSQALEQIFNLVIERYIKTWYDNISDNEDFIMEIKNCIQFMMASLLNRISRIDISEVLSRRIIPAILNHVEICQSIQKSECSSHMSASFSLEDSVLSRMGSHLHIAMTTRQNELQYQRSLVASILPSLLHHTGQQSQSVFALLNEIFASTVFLSSMDALANPDNLNRMLILMRQDQSNFDTSSSQKVPILANYYKEWSDWMQKKPMPKQIEKILQDTQEFYPFLQYMKSIKAVSPINFLTVLDEINKALLRPSIPTQECIKIQESLKQLKSLRDVDPELDKLGLSPKFWSVVNQTIDDPPECVEKLCQNEEWLMAYDAVCKTLESFYLPDYFESEEYMKLLYGERDPTPTGREISSEKQRDFPLSRFGSRIKHVLSGTTLEGQAMPDVVQGEEAASLYSDCVDSDIPPDLSTWRVSIPSLSQPFIEQKKLGQFLYHVQSIRVDQEKLVTTVYRKYSEFFVLEQKLNEFHGNVGLQLATKKQFTSKNIEFLDSKRTEFEHFLQFLLTRPFLKNSELLFNFLTSQTEFNSNILLDLSIGRLMKSVPMKLTKERGQYLEGFLSSFQMSCESPRQASQCETKESVELSPSKMNLSPITSSLDIRLHSLLYWNNAGKPLSLQSKQKDCEFKYHEVTGYFDIMELLMKHIYDDKPEWLSSLIRSVRPVLKSPIEMYIKKCVSARIMDAVKDQKMVPALESLKEIIFFSSASRNDLEKQSRKAEAFTAFKESFPNLLSWWCGDERFQENLSSIFNVFQQPKWNKQLSYILLDIVIELLFPELFNVDLDSSTKTSPS